MPPAADMLLFTGDAERVRVRMLAEARARVQAGQQVGLLLTTSDMGSFDAGSFEVFVLGDDLDEVSQRLFMGLRDLESRGVDVIMARDITREGLGMAVWDRLLRAAEGQVIHVD